MCIKIFSVKNVTCGTLFTNNDDIYWVFYKLDVSQT